MEHYYTSTNSRGYYHHAGIDFNGTHDFSTDVISYIYAKVEVVGYRVDFGNFIICSNMNDKNTFYILGHLKSVSVKKNDIIIPDCKLGKIGNTGKCYSRCGGKYPTAVRVEKYPNEFNAGWGTHLHLQVEKCNGIYDFYNESADTFLGANVLSIIIKNGVNEK